MSILSDFKGAYSSKRKLGDITYKAAVQFANEINSQSPTGVGIQAHRQNVRDIQEAFLAGKPTLARTIKNQRKREAVTWAKNK